ncbi:MAG: hypothetical protein A2511_06160 [Deltaproteobacteria bacterium RIFOXYD12_FULL_50_9]|nr:MAG: hypothetical protein A2511_06160 [Deltaproteobacteria bacterium RIFOXYD12_FULL_50_9]
MYHIVFLSLCVLLAGCANLKHFFPLSACSEAPAVYIRPVSADLSRQAVVGVLPFQMPANMSREQGAGVAALFKDVLLAKQAFQVVRLLDTRFGDINEAILYGRRAKVDLVLAGRINYAIDGADLGGARVDVSVRLVNVATGNTIWYVEQTMDKPMEYPDVGFVNRLLTAFSAPEVRRPAGPPALPNMLAKIAGNMADLFVDSRDPLP